MQMNERLCRVLCAIYRGFCRVAHPVKVEGKENLPAEGAAILYANHQNLQDPMVLFAYLGRPLHFMAKKELFENKVLAKVLTLIGAFPVSRGENDMTAIRTSLSVLSEGKVLGIFPEGHRYTDGEIHAAHNGVSLIALRSGAQVVPVRIQGSYRIFSKINVKVGAPVDLADLQGRLRGENLSTATERMMAALKAL